MIKKNICIKIKVKQTIVKTNNQAELNEFWNPDSGFKKIITDMGPSVIIYKIEKSR